MDICNDDIYSNDIAMDMFWKLRAEYESTKKLDKAIKSCKESVKYNNNESKLLIADIEFFYTGNLTNIDEVNAIIDDELSLINNWDNPESRKEHLLNLKNKINFIEDNHKTPIRKKIKEFFEIIDQKDIVPYF